MGARVIVLFLRFNPNLTQKIISQYYLAFEFLQVFPVETRTNYKSKISLMKVFKKLQFVIVASISMMIVPYGYVEAQKSFPAADSNNSRTVQEQNLRRSMQLFDRSMEVYFSADRQVMYRFYNPDTKVRSQEKASVWMYSASIEAVNAILGGLKSQKEKGNYRLFDQNYKRYVNLLAELHGNAAYYLGSFNFTSFTQTKDWTVYAVDRVGEKGKANVTGVLNVYDDQMWMIRELIEGYRLTGKDTYLKEAEYLTAYVLDGWDCTRDNRGHENGGIPWGPGYVTKHACSNAPMVSPLVWLHEIYKTKKDLITYRYIDIEDKQSRRSKTIRKSKYYLDFAKRIYAWQKDHLLNDKGVYDDMLGECYPDCSVAYEIVDGIKYRKNTQLRRAVGTSFSYNSGTMISGAADLYRATQSKIYLEDGEQLTDASFQYFATPGSQVPTHYTYASDGFNNWFNGVLLRGFLQISPVFKKAGSYKKSFQQNLDYGYTHFLRSGLLPQDLLGGWHADTGKNSLEGMFMFAYAAQYAMLSQDHDGK